MNIMSEDELAEAKRVLVALRLPVTVGNMHTVYACRWALATEFDIPAADTIAQHAGILGVSAKLLSEAL